ncbi:MAG: DUF6498-containing protein [Candidatus Micrarchaeota archaeon]
MLINLKLNFRDPSTLFLVIANLVTIFFAIIENWTLATIMFIYWTQSIIIGFFTVIKILTAKVKHAPKPEKIIKGKISTFTAYSFGGQVFMAVFFLIHYGLFHYGYYEFLIDNPFLTGEIFSSTLPKVDFSAVYFTSILFFINHLISYFYNFVVKKEREMDSKNLIRLMFFPYARIFPMHLTIIFGGIISMIGFALGLKQAIFFVLILFLVLKTIADVSMHSAEHSKENWFTKLIEKKMKEAEKGIKKRN